MLFTSNTLSHIIKTIMQPFNVKTKILGWFEFFLVLSLCDQQNISKSEKTESEMGVSRNASLCVTQP